VTSVPCTWVDAYDVADLDNADVAAVTLRGCPYALFRSPTGEFYATDGLCTHERVKLTDGLVDGLVIVCPKHGGQFDYTTGKGFGPPIFVNLATYPTKVEHGRVFIGLPNTSE
jgi:3-phenylpropionate/trans-cinnamate dioxygenase ferredoxin component